ncbi:uncharacterized protein LOC143268669 [Peromyscus maniculatus bairdii]|uniref:uncharacterized protein LOC143268669 n=1 Tax=Peromyscus maniculatus bairdii TaxID=230844 RepID=UPI003FD37108
MIPKALAKRFAPRCECAPSAVRTPRFRKPDSLERLPEETGEIQDSRTREDPAQEQVTVEMKRRPCSRAHTLATSYGTPRQEHRKVRAACQRRLGEKTGAFAWPPGAHSWSGPLWCSMAAVNRYLAAGSLSEMQAPISVLE